MVQHIEGKTHSGSMDFNIYIFAKISQLLEFIYMRLPVIITSIIQLCSVQGAGEQGEAGSLPAGSEEQQSQCGGLASGEEISGRK